MEHSMRVIVGGVGGGGDVGLALLIALDALRGAEAVIASFQRCSSKTIKAERITGALVRPLPHVDYGPRTFEDKLLRLGIRREKVHIICTRDLYSEIVEGLEHVVQEHAPDAILYTDIGGDALLLGYESRLGSYVTDTVARAAIAEVAKRYSTRAVLGIGAIGAEGGGGYLSMSELTADILYLHKFGALIGSYLPKPESSWVGWALLRYAESGMLPLYLIALSGRVGEARIRSAYLRGAKVRVLPHYKYIIVLDAVKHCDLSPLCLAVKRGRADVKEWKVLKPPQGYIKAREMVEHRGWEKVLNEIIESVIIDAEDLARMLAGTQQEKKR